VSILLLQLALGLVFLLGMSIVWADALRIRRASGLEFFIGAGAASWAVVLLLLSVHIQG
jgi:hypothetical protein